ncbi:MAG: flagellar export protein FliJ [Helicobacteraceae bacterium]|jgi:hypothetical protein|nr:flagellar export protein FliJ [Helicobacteraceae bacterium]
MRGLFQLAQIKNAKAEELQRELGKVLANIALKERALSALQLETASARGPISGAFGDLKNFEVDRAIRRREIKTAQQEIFALHQKAFQLRFHLKRAHIEYEKINRLDRERKAAIALNATRSENKRLDDVAINARHILRGGR